MSFLKTQFLQEIIKQFGIPRITIKSCAWIVLPFTPYEANFVKSDRGPGYHDLINLLFVLDSFDSNYKSSQRLRRTPSNPLVHLHFIVIHYYVDTEAMPAAALSRWLVQEEFRVWQWKPSGYKKLWIDGNVMKMYEILWIEKLQWKCEILWIEFFSAKSGPKLYIDLWLLHEQWKLESAKKYLYCLFRMDFDKQVRIDSWFFFEFSIRNQELSFLFLYFFNSF